MAMLDRIAGNRDLKEHLRTALQSGRLSHSILLVGEPGCGAGFAARCLAADYLYPAGGAHAEAVLRQEDPESITLRRRGASGQIRVEDVRAARDAIQRSALSSDAAGRAMFVYDAQDLNAASANTLLKIIEEPPDGVIFLFTASSAAAVLPTIRSRCAAYSIAPVEEGECAEFLRRERPELTERQARDLAFLYEGHIDNCLRAVTDPDAKAARSAARELCRQAEQQDTYRAAALLAGYEKDKEGAYALLWQAVQAASAALRRPGFDGLSPDAAARVVRAADHAVKVMRANGNPRLALTVCGIEMTQTDQVRNDP